VPACGPHDVSRLLGSLYLATHSTKDETSDAAGPATSVVRIDVRLGRARRLRDLDSDLNILPTVVEDFESEFKFKF
jgi:hypothetical protein